jgi:16S rRNA (guanine1207-N2)-methyltransferase
LGVRHSRTGRHSFTVSPKGVDLTFETWGDVFSPKGLDPGTAAMLSQVEFGADEKVLDLGCGYGLVGILAARLIGAARVVMCDVDPHALELARSNAQANGVEEIRIVQSDGFRDLDENDFTLILCNPPYHADFAVPKEFIHKGFNRLRIGGRMVMVTRRRAWYQRKLTAIFGGTRVSEVDGYFVFTSEKRRARYANA